jgi:NAD(P)-dependent dehydrogenase (short-subunit alcohol dehydrogenase family)
MQRRSFETPLEHRRLLRLAREYARAGYDVLLYPQNDDLPESLQECSIALLAKRGDETIVADVRSRHNLTLNGADDLRRLVEKVEAIPGGQFNLVVTNPRQPKCREAS